MSFLQPNSLPVQNVNPTSALPQHSPLDGILALTGQLCNAILALVKSAPQPGLPPNFLPAMTQSITQCISQGLARPTPALLPPPTPPPLSQTVPSMHLLNQNQQNPNNLNQQNAIISRPVLHLNSAVKPPELKPLPVTKTQLPVIYPVAIKPIGAFIESKDEFEKQKKLIDKRYIFDDNDTGDSRKFLPSQVRIFVFEYKNYSW